LGAGFRTSSGGGRHGLALPHPAVRMAAATKGSGDGYSLLAPPRFELSRPRGWAAHGRGGDDGGGAGSAPPPTRGHARPPLLPRGHAGPPLELEKREREREG